ncbi:MAG: hypothetical protein A2666_05390 [Parcubacteria group bacterium RIFCSPHIGHO2_01_FULL_47_10b]|nr:MAG: hypothetical protein A2666_05390 [Parcubacteria group bacterium RIFCSPHIGHO2_01_FULL_47_10b]
MTKKTSIGKRKEKTISYPAIGASRPIAGCFLCLEILDKKRGLAARWHPVLQDFRIFKIFRSKP